MKKLLFTTLLVICIISISNAQGYKTGVGLRAGFSAGGLRSGSLTGLTIKHFISPKSAFEGLLTTKWKGLEVTGLYEIYNHPFETKRLNLYTGIGGHICFYDGDNLPWTADSKNVTAIGLDGILGLEYSFLKAPVNISLDWKPDFTHIERVHDFSVLVGGLSIRYIF